MQMLLISIVLVVLLNGLFYMPLYYRLRKTRRSRQLQEARTEITKCATEFQKYLAEKHTVCGQYVHDIHYETINAAQFFDKYVVVRAAFGQRKGDVYKIQKAIEQELEALSPEIKELSERFFRAYLFAAYNRHPVKFKVLIACLLGRFVFEKIRSGVLGSLFVDALTPSFTVAIWIVAIGVSVFGNVQKENLQVEQAKYVTGVR